MKKIPLTQGKFALVDDEDYQRVMDMGRWCLHSAGYANKTICSKDESGKIKRSALLMHRFVMNCPASYLVDHINGNRLDNQKENLRLCNKSENAWNSKIPKNNRTGFKGVMFKTREQKYEARLTVNHRKISLGYFVCPVAAARVYNAAALELHGEFAKLNQIPAL